MEVYPPKAQPIRKGFVDETKISIVKVAELELRQDLIDETRVLIWKACELLQSLNERELDYLYKSSPSYRWLIETLRRLYST